MTGEVESISYEPPYGAMTVVYRRSARGFEYLLLHRRFEAAHQGDWAWDPPAGNRLSGEDADVCAARELLEETGLGPAVRRADVASSDWLIYLAEAAPDAIPRLSQEHDRYVWLPLDRAAECVLPERVRRSLVEAAGSLGVE